MLLDYCDTSLNKAVDDCSAVWMGCANCYVISSIKASLTIYFCLTITCALNSLRTWPAYSWDFLHPTTHQTQANPSKRWLQSQSKNRVKNPRSGLGVASLLNNRPCPSSQNRAKPGSVKAALCALARKSFFTLPLLGTLYYVDVLLVLKPEKAMGVDPGAFLTAAQVIN